MQNNINDILDDKAKDIFKDTPPPTINDTEDEAGVATPVTTDTLETPQHNYGLASEDAKKIIYHIKNQLDALLRVIDGEHVSIQKAAHPDATVLSGGERIIEGVFTGDKMMGEDGKEYTVPPNYASKSKLVEGDVMKLTITNNGSFIYKQIQQVDRKRVTGELTQDESGNWSAVYNGKPYKILTASATFYKGNPGDDVVMLIPDDGESSWGAVENIISKNS